MQNTHLFVELFKAFILGREAALGGHIDDHDDLALEGGKVELFSPEVLDNKIKETLGHVFSCFQIVSF